MVHTFADADTKEARANNLGRLDRALASGAQVISTDFIQADPRISKYEARLHSGHVGQCDALFGPERCDGLDVESGRDSVSAVH